MIYFHIGLPKSGSSAVQAYLNENHNALKKGGVLYPWPYSYSQKYRTSGGNGSIILRSLREWDKGVEPSFVKDELERFSKRFDKIIVSSEGFSTDIRNPEDLYKVIPDGIPVAVIIYLRNQVDKFVSDVNQTIKNSKRDNYSISENWFRFNNYYDHVKRWVEAFGRDRVVVRGYNKQAFENNDIVSDFCKITSIPRLGFDEKTPINPSLSLFHLEIMRQLNIIAHEKGGDAWRIKKFVKDFVWESSVETGLKGGKETYIKKEVLEEISTRLRESNDKLRSDYDISGMDLEESVESYTCIEPPVECAKACADTLYRLALSYQNFEKSSVC